MSGTSIPVIIPWTAQIKYEKWLSKELKIFLLKRLAIKHPQTEAIITRTAPKLLDIMSNPNCIKSRTKILDTSKLTESVT